MEGATSLKCVRCDNLGEFSTQSGARCNEHAALEAVDGHLAKQEEEEEEEEDEEEGEDG